MDAIDLVALASFVFVTTFTPGPNNITSASMGLVYGYRKTLNYLLGVTAGVFLIMLVSALVSRLIYALLPSLETPIRFLGAAYILWLTYKTLQSSYQQSGDEPKAFGFVNGLLLQALNPKLWVYTLTLYTTFLAPVTGQVVAMIISAALLAAVAFLATSTWALFGMGIKTFLRAQVQKIVNTVLALLLVYVAIEMLGLL